MNAMTPRLLIDNMGTFVVREVTEGSTKGRLIARGEFAKCDEATANGRVYSRKLWEREIGRLASKITERQVFGELDHPMDGKTSLKRVSHIITNLQVAEDGRVVGEAEIIDTSNGKELKALMQAGARVGVSSRGFGSTVPDGKGRELVAEDYRLMTFDFVADPADETAIPEVYSEDLSQNAPTSASNQEIEMGPLTLESLKKLHPELVKQIAEEAVKTSTSTPEQVEALVNERIASLKSQFESDLLTRVSQLKEDARDQVRGDLMSDPEIGRAKITVDKIKELLTPHVLPEDADAVVTAKNEEIAGLKKRISDLAQENATLKSDLQELEEVSRAVGYQLHIERRVVGDEFANDIRTRLKGATFESVEQIDERIEEIRSSLQEGHAQQSEREKEMEELRKRNQALKEQLDSALSAGTAIGHIAYLERRIGSHPHAAKIRKLAEDREFADEKEIDAFVATYTAENPVSEEFTRVRSRLSRADKHSGDGGAVVVTESSSASSVVGEDEEVVAGVTMSQLAEAVKLTR